MPEETIQRAARRAMAAPTRPALERTAFRTSRLLDFASEKELVAQVGHQKAAWPLVILKELVDNAIDAAEEAGSAPAVSVVVDDSGITVDDNGPGIPAEVVEDLLDFSVRVSSREAYVSPTRGAQGNALKRFSSLKRWALAVAARRGMKRAKVALARKLASILHRMWVDGTGLRFGQEVAAA